MTKAQLAVVAGFVVCVRAPVFGQSTDLGQYVVFGDQKASLGSKATVDNGHLGSNDTLVLGRRVVAQASVDVAGALVRIGSEAVVPGDVFFNELRASSTAQLGPLHQFITLPIIALQPPPENPATGPSLIVQSGSSSTLAPGAYASIEVRPGATLVLQPGDFVIDSLKLRGSGHGLTTMFCQDTGGTCVLQIRTLASLGANHIGVVGGPIGILFSGTRTVVVGRSGGVVRATIYAPSATVRLKSSAGNQSSFAGLLAGRQVRVGSGASLSLSAGGGFCGDNVAQGTEDCDGTDDAACPGACEPDCECPPPSTCGDGVRNAPAEACDPPDDALCPGTCLSNCQCPVAGGAAVLHAVGPSVLHNATSFGVQIFGENFVAGAELELSDKSSGVILATLPTTWLSSTEMTALVPAGLPVPTGIQRELTAKVINPGAPKSAPPDIGHCSTDGPNTPAACTNTAQCQPNAGTCVTGDQRLTLFNDAVFLNPNSAAVVPSPFGVCNNGTPCQSAAACGGGTCSPKLYVTPQQRDELWVYNTGTGQFVDRDSGASGIQGIPVGDNPFHVEILAAGGPARAWVVNRFDDSLSIVDPATDTELARVTGAALGVPGRLRMETEIEFNRAGTRAYLSNENLDEVQVLDISGVLRDAPVLIDAVDVGVNPRGMATNTADTRLYVANVQSADVSVVDIAPGSATENQVIATIAPRAVDNIVGGRAEGWEPFVIGGRAPRGIVYSDTLGVLFITSIGPQTGPRQGVVQTGGAIINPTITVVDTATNTVRAHVAMNIFDRDRPSCTDPELMALDDARGRLFVTCQGSGTIDVLDASALASGVQAEDAVIPLPLPTDAVVPTLALPSTVGAFGAKVCGAFTNNRGAACTTDANCGGCPTLVEGLPVVCCATNNPVGVHNGPRGIAIAPDGDTLWVVNQFTTSISTLDTSPSDPTLIGVASTTSFPGAFGTGTQQRDRRLGQIEFFTDVKKTGISCATCHIDDHQDGVFFEADVRGPRLRRVLSVRGTRDFLPLLQDQLVPDLMSFTDIVVQAERGGPIPCIPCIEIGGSPFCFNGGTCTVTSDSENQQNALYAKAISFFPNPNLNADGSFSTAVPLPGGGTGDATLGAELFDSLACQSCHPEPMFTIDQLRAFDSSTLGQPLRMRETGTPVFIPLRAQCQDVNRPTGVDGSAGFTVPTLRGTWDTFPLLLSGSAGLGAVGPEPTFTPGCTPGGNGCCTQLRSPLNPSGTVFAGQHLAVTTKDAMRAVLTAPLAVPGTGHGAALTLTPSELDALIAYIRSL
jgi:DNA-binding beta-propeller fold protein YncE